VKAGRPLLIVAAACAALWALYLSFGFHGYSEDPVWYLEPARAWARGEGLTTRLLYPAQLAQFPQGVQLPVPPLHHGPLALLLMGLLYRVLGFSDWVPMLYSFGGLLAAGVLAYKLARELAGERAGLLAAALYWTHPMILRATQEELTDPLFTVLVLLGALALRRAERDRPGLWAAASGLCLGLASATRLAGQAYWLAFFGGCWYLLRSPRALYAMAGGFAAAMVPLALYNYAAAGVFFYSPGIYVLLWSKTFPGFRSSTTYMNLTTAQAVLAYPADVLQKAVTGSLYAVNRFLEAAQGPYLSAAIAFGLFSSFADRKAERFRRFCWIFLLPVAAVNVVISYGGVHYLLPLFPLLCALAAVWLWEFVEHSPWLFKRPALLAALGALLFLSPLALTLKDRWKGRPTETAYYSDLAAFGEFLRKSTEPAEVTYSDKPAAVVWFGERASIALTATMDDAEKAFAHLAPDALVLTSLRVYSEDYDPAWSDAFIKGDAILGFEPCEEFKSGSFTAALYRRLGACKRQL
jgi:4-amino-4-deoxy-L-arabinose transferase-like glycosyltransferase